MSVSHLVLTVVWLLVSAAWAWLAYDEYKSSIDIRIWPDVMASVSAFIVFIIYVAKAVIGA